MSAQSSSENVDYKNVDNNSALNKEPKQRPKSASSRLYTRPVPKKGGRPMSSGARARSSSDDIRGPRPHSARMSTVRPTSASATVHRLKRPVSATLLQDTMESLFRSHGARPHSADVSKTFLNPNDRVQRLEYVQRAKLKESKGRVHSSSFNSELERLEGEIEAVRDATVQMHEAKQKQQLNSLKVQQRRVNSPKYRRRGLGIGVNENSHNFLVSDNERRVIDPATRDASVQDEDFNANIDLLLSPPKRKAKEMASGVNELKVSHFMRKTGKHHDESDDSFDDDPIEDYVEDDSYRKRVADMVVVQQMMTAHEINKRHREEKKRPRKSMAKTLRERMKDAHAVHRFSESMKFENDNFESLALLCETRLNEAIAHTSLVEDLPDEYRTAVVCDIMLRLTPVFGRYDALVTVLIKELLRSIYGEFDNVLGSVQRGDTDALLNLGKPYFATLRRLEAEHTLTKSMLRNVQGKASNMENTLQRGQKTLQSVLRLWDGRHLEQYFKAWKSVLVNKIVSHNFVENQFKRAKLRIWFHGWRFRVLKGGTSQSRKREIGTKEDTQKIMRMAKLLRDHVDGSVNPRIRNTITKLMSRDRRSISRSPSKAFEASESDASSSESEEDGIDEGDEDSEEQEASQPSHQKDAKKNFQGIVVKQVVKDAQNEHPIGHRQAMGNNLHLDDFGKQRLEDYKRSPLMPWLFNYITATSCENAALEKKVKELEHKLEGLKLKVNSDEWRSVNNTSERYFSKFRSNIHNYIVNLQGRHSVRMEHESEILHLFEGTAISNENSANTSLYWLEHKK